MKKRNEAITKLWKKWSDAYTAIVEVWKAKCAELCTKGVKVHDLPKKPVQPQKVNVKKEVNGENDGVGDKDEDNGSSDGDGDVIEFDKWAYWVDFQKQQRSIVIIEFINMQSYQKKTFHL